MGRIGVFEVFPITTRIRELIASRASEVEIRQAAIAEGMKTLAEDALDKVKAGITTIEELRRVVYLEGEGVSVCCSCNRVLSADFTVCPYCGSSVDTICPNCCRRRSLDWIVCPYCRTALN